MKRGERIKREGVRIKEVLVRQRERLRRELAGIPRQTLRSQLLCIVAAAVLALFSWYMGRQSSPVRPGNLLERSGEGGSTQVYELMVDGLAESRVPVQVEVSPKRYTRQEADELFRELARTMEDRICGGNSSLAAVSEDLNLPRSVPELGVRLRWTYAPDMPGGEKEEQQAHVQKYRRLIDEDGTVNNEGFASGEEVEGTLSVVMETYIEPEGNPEYEKNRYRSEPFQFFVYVTAPKLDDAEWMRRLLADELAAADRQSYGSETMKLPDTLAGRQLRYSGRQDRSWIIFLFLGAAAALALYLRDKTSARDRKKQRDSQLLLDYSELVSKLMVYLGAGLSVRSAFERISAQHDEMVGAQAKQDRYLYEELRTCRRQFERGMPESSVYVDFGKRVNLKPYTKLCSLIEQNRKNGSKNMRMLLNIEMTEAFEQRKNIARRLGEEAGTKLLLPLFLLLGVVMTIVIVPAMMALG